MPSGAELLAGNDAETARIVRDYSAARAIEARHDLVAFFDFVAREENTRKRIKVAPHQRLMLDFVMHHRRSVIMLPIGHAKSSSAALLTLHLLGHDPTTRGAILSATEDQAEKIIKMVRSYLGGDKDEQLTSPELRLVFPRLLKSQRKGDPWTQTQLTVQRPPGIRDASVIGLGLDSKKLPGSRLNWVIIDDVLNTSNTSTKDQRDKAQEWIDIQVLSRLDPKQARIAVFNTPFHRDDILHRLMARGWATLRMDVEAGVFIQDDAERMRLGEAPFDHELIVADGKNHPETAGRSWFFGKLDAHHHLPPNERTLWPERMNRAKVESEREEYIANPNRFAQLYMGICRDAIAARCKVEWVEACKRHASELGFKTLQRKSPEGISAIFTGIDLAFAKGEHNDLTALATIAILPSKLRLLVDLEFGQWDTFLVAQKAIAKHRQFGSVIRVETNAGQKMMKDIISNIDISVPILSHTTNAQNKYDRLTGVEAFFTELANGAWLLPSDEWGRTPPEVQALIDACLDYEPDKHTSDLLMAITLARHQAFEWGLLTNLDASKVAQGAAEIASMALSR